MIESFTVFLIGFVCLKLLFALISRKKLQELREQLNTEERETLRQGERIVFAADSSLVIVAVTSMKFASTLSVWGLLVVLAFIFTLMAVSVVYSSRNNGILHGGK